MAREYSSYAKTTDELIADAGAVLRAGDAAREAIEQGRSPSAAFARARKLLAPYGIRTEEPGNLSGTVLGIVFTDPHYLSGADSVYKIA